MNLDPLAEFTRKYSPYSYAFNNPVYFIDIEGLIPDGSTYFTDYYDDGSGNVIYDPDVHGPDDVPDGATYIGLTYTDPNTGTFWDESGKPHTQTQNLDEVVVIGESKDSGGITGDGLVVWGIGGRGADSRAGGGIVRGNDRGSGSISVGGNDINPFFGLVWWILSHWFPKDNNAPKPNQSTMEQQPEEELSEQVPYNYFLSIYKNGKKDYVDRSSKQADGIEKAKSIIKQNDKVDSIVIKPFYLGPTLKSHTRTGRDTTIVRN